MPSLRTVNNRVKRRAFVKRHRWLKAVARVLAVALDCPSRPWFRLSLPGDTSHAR